MNSRMYAEENQIYAFSLHDSNLSTKTFNINNFEYYSSLEKNKIEKHSLQRNPNNLYNIRMATFP